MERDNEEITDSELCIEFLNCLKFIAIENEEY